ncbi:hypothetical protein C1645_839226 [Glomus cerebriforme]|uniref:DUF659 domain-containing protein n=1 Tax=Glomus cerebriforme TaxID=658196 RepID=A0A397S5W4_9GLOM|nr:hypothetical protein C1645_839226 [Glomus cerebriforme]
MINFANPELKLPSQKVLADELGVTICFDGWKNVKKQEIMGSVLLLLMNKFYDLDKQNIKYNAIITDSASSNQAARYVKLLIVNLNNLN